MRGRCSLDTKLNNCPYFVKKWKECKIENSVCCFYEPSKLMDTKGPVKEPKWFEKYYQ